MQQMCQFNGANIFLETKAQAKRALLQQQNRHALHGSLESWLLAPADQGNPVEFAPCLPAQAALSSSLRGTCKMDDQDLCDT